MCEAALDHGDWDCFLLAGRYTLLEQSALDSFLPKCSERGCSVVVGGPYKSGILATGVRNNDAGHYNFVAAPADVVEKVAKIETVCEAFGIALSRFMTLNPGDIISTGTPPGVGLGQKPPVFLKPGDRIELGITSLGTQRQTVVAYT